MKAQTKFILTGILVLGLAGNIFPQTQTLNYIQSYAVQIPGITNTTSLTINTPASTAIQAIQYFDGLGRPLQTVQKGIAPDGGDLIKPYIYNNVGLDEINYEPYVATPLDGQYRGNFEIAQPQFYSDNFDNDIFGRSPIKYEKSPLNRILQLGAPGGEYQVDGGHTINFEYLTNNTSNAMLNAVLWKVSGNSCTTTGSYANNQLYIAKTTNEDGAYTYEFKDKQGQVVLKRSVIGDNNETLVSTYYLYDDFGLLRFVISPEGSAQITGSFDATSALAKKYVYCYTYDARKRLIEKQIPGKEPEYYVYDKTDKVVLYQDGNMRNKADKEWMFTKYDAMSRIVQTGISIAYSNKTRQNLQNDANNHTGRCWEIVSYNSNSLPYANNYYSNDAFPVIGPDDIYDLHTLNYYDTYNAWANSASEPILLCSINELQLPGSTGVHPVTNGYNSQVAGMPTVSYNYVVDKSISLSNAIYYDKYGRPTYTAAQNHLQGYDVNTITYHGLTQLPMNVDHTQFSFKRKGGDAMSPPLPNYNPYIYELNEKYEYSYDHAGRQTQMSYTFLNNDDLKQEVLFSYNQLGKLTGKQVSGGKNDLQNTTYAYNIRGWLTQINNPEEVAPNGDLFGMQFFYNTQNTNLNNTPAFNGNITGVIWQTSQPTGVTMPVTTGMKAYKYSYDKLNRLLSGIYSEKNNNQTWDPNNKYNEIIKNTTTGKSYDLNGNIIGLQRNGMLYPNNSGLLDDLSYYYKGNQLVGVDDANNTNNGNDFFDNYNKYAPTMVDEYSYDDNGNLTRDNNKGIIKIDYNYLNLPSSISKSGGDRIEYVFDAGGTKLTQFQYLDGNLIKTTDFAGNFVYENERLVYVNNNEGRIIHKADETWLCEYYLKDHLGNVRVAYCYENNALKTRQVNSYYPFGMNIKGLTGNCIDINRPNEYLYNGKMMQDEMGLNWLDYWARFYDPVLGRWHSVDPMSEISRKWSPYSYCYNNPIRFVDPDGMVADKFLDEQGNVIRDTGKGDNEYVVKTTQTQEDIYGKDNVALQKKELADVNGISKKDADKTKTEILSAPVNEDGSLSLTSEAQNNLVKLPTDAQQKYMSSVVASDNGNGGTAFENKNNNQEHGGFISQSGSYRRVLSGPIMYSGGKASITFEEHNGSETSFHSHLSGNIDGTMWVQGPTSQDQHDLGKSGNFYSYVFGRRTNTVYIYNKTGVVATIPDKVFK